MSSATLSMTSEVRQDLKIPLYHQIFMILRDQIVQGQYAEGATLPSEVELSQAYEVSRVTAKRALNELADAGLAVRERGRGTHVAPHAHGTQFHGSVQSLAKSLRQRPGTVIHVMAFDYVPASSDVAEALQLPPGSIIQKAQRLNERKGEPYSFLTTHVPASIGKAWSESEMKHKPLITLLEESGYGVVRAEQQVTAVLADGQTAQLLNVAAGSPLLKILRVAFSKDGQAVEYLIGLYPPERYQLSISLTRNDTELR